MQSRFCLFVNMPKRNLTDAAKNGTSVKKVAGPWNMGLKAAMDDPSARIEADEQIVIIKDKYPKVKV